MKKIITFFVTILFVFGLNQSLLSQEKKVNTPKTEVKTQVVKVKKVKSFKKSKLPKNYFSNESKLFKGLKFRHIGPATMSGRVSYIDCVEKNPNIIYVGAATGGLWKSIDNGTTWKPIFDKQNTQSIGAIAIYQKNPDIVYVGTGEANVRNSAGVGRGIFKTLDGGKTWKFLGLKNTERISKIVINPDNPDIVYVAALGKLWGDSKDRGLYKSIDGGKTWKKILYVNEKTGCADIAMSPSNPNKLLVSMWEFRRLPWYFTSGGKGSGLYITVDSGKSFKKLTQKDGLPSGQLGRIGVAYSKSNPDVAYALVEAKRSVLLKSEDSGYKWRTVNNKTGISDRPFYYSRIFVNPINENIIYLPQSRLKVSQDGGKTFKGMANFSQAHSDFHALWVSPDGNKIVIGNDGGVDISYDKGKHWNFIQNLPLGQFYHVSYDMETPYNIYGGLQDNGSWRGPAYVLKSWGISNYDWMMVGFGDGFDTEPDPEDSNCGYGMSQGGNLFYYNIKTAERRDIMPFEKDVKDRYNWNSGFAIDPLDPKTIYFGSQFLHKSTDKGRTWEVISKDLTTNDPSKLNQKLSGGLTRDVTEAENYETIITISPSPVKRGIIWVGTDDGNLQLTTDGGKTWKNVVKYLVRKRMVPKGTWIPHVEASHFDEATAYVVFDDHRRSNWNTYVFVTHNFGKSWKSLATREIDGFVHVIREDLKNKNLLFLGTEFGLYFSYNGGKKWIKWPDFPSVPVRDIGIHPRENDLIIGTHGRGIYIIDDISPLRELNNSVLMSNFYLFNTPDGINFIRGWMPSSISPGDGAFMGQNKTIGLRITYYINPYKLKELKKDKKTKDEPKKEMRRPYFMRGGNMPFMGKGLDIEILDMNNKLVKKVKGSMKEGINRAYWFFNDQGIKTPYSRGRRVSGLPVLPGKYKVKIKFNGKDYTNEFNVKLDPRLKYDINVLRSNRKKAKEVQKWMETITTVYEKLNKTKKIATTITKNIKELDKKYVNKIRPLLMKLNKKLDSYLKKILIKEERQGIFDESDQLINKIYSLISLIDYEPLNQAFKAKYKKLKPEIVNFVNSINNFYKTDYKDLIKLIKESGFTLFKPEKEIKL